MLSWFRRRKYRNDVLAEMMAIHLFPDNRFQAFLAHYFPGAFTAIQNGYKTGQDTTELAMTISGTVLSTMIEGLDETRRRLVREEMIEWASTSGAIYGSRSAVGSARDGFAGRLKWAIAYAANLDQEKSLMNIF